MSDNNVCESMGPVSPGNPLPCPFCGSTDVGGAGGTVGCYRCPAEIAVQNANTAYAVELWNNRAANHPQPAQQGVPEGWSLTHIDDPETDGYLVKGPGISYCAWKDKEPWLYLFCEALASATPQPEGEGDE